jgi:hypothetical protein
MVVGEGEPNNGMKSFLITKPYRRIKAEIETRRR